jgi:hypothetical protein
MLASAPTLRRSKRLALKQAGADEAVSARPPMVVDRPDFDEVDDFDLVAACALQLAQRQDMHRQNAQAFLRGVALLGGEHDLHAEDNKHVIAAALASYLMPESSDDE